MACCGEYQVSEEDISRQRQWRPQIYRKCTDIPWLVIFLIFWSGLMFITGYAITAGATERLMFGYDSFGNICGRRNTPVKNAPLSGQDMSEKKHVFFLDSCSLEVRNLKINSTALCVSSCPQHQLSSLEDVTLFAKNNGSFLCVYSVNYTDYARHPKAAELCPVLPIPPSSVSIIGHGLEIQEATLLPVFSKSFPMFNRCVPENPDCYSRFASVLINVVNEVDVFHRILSGIMAGRDNVIGLSVLAVVLSVIMIFIFRYITTLLVHIVITLVIFGLVFVSGVLWWLYYDHINDPTIELESAKENAKFLLVFAIIATIITLVLLSLILVLWKRIQMTIQIIRIASDFISQVPLLLLQPLWTFLILIFFWVFWVAVLLSLGTAGSAQVVSGGQVEYRSVAGIRYMWWYHLVGLVWTSEFILACQQMVIAGTVVTLYFNRAKNNPAPYPIGSSMHVLLCYHQGTVIKGAFLLTLVRIPRIVLMCLHNILKGKENSCASGLSKCCSCCFCCLEKFLHHLNQDAYIATAINATDFCTSAKEASAMLSKSSLSVASLNCFGDFLVFLGKVFVVCFTIFGGLMAFNYHRELHVWVVPMLLVAFFAYLVAHSFLSVFEMVVDSLFLCYVIDMETNDGSAEKPYFMDTDLMAAAPTSCVDIPSTDSGALALIYASSNRSKKMKNAANASIRSPEEATEMQPMVKP